MVGVCNAGGMYGGGGGSCAPVLELEFRNCF